jgi:Domain of unknown function (DUF4395)
MVFAVGAFAGLQLHPYGLIYRTFVAPRLGAPTEWEDPVPVRFTQGVGLAFTIVGTIGYATGLTALALTVTALALGAAFLNAAFGFCLAARCTSGYRFSCAAGKHPVALGNMADAGQITASDIAALLHGNGPRRPGTWLRTGCARCRSGLS